jgi:hypothetical protein
VLHSGRVDFGEIEVVVFGRRAAEVVAEARPESYPGTGPKHQPNFPLRTTRPRPPVQ